MMKTKIVETLSILFIKCCESNMCARKGYFYYKCNVPPMVAMILRIYVPNAKMTNTN